MIASILLLDWTRAENTCQWQSSGYSATRSAGPHRALPSADPDARLEQAGPIAPEALPGDLAAGHGLLELLQGGRREGLPDQAQPVELFGRRQLLEAGVGEFGAVQAQGLQLLHLEQFGD